MVALPDVPGIGPTINGDAISGDGQCNFREQHSQSDADAFAWDELHGHAALPDCCSNRASILVGGG